MSPELLGQPLARPSRRAVALTVDGLLIAILANAPSVIFGIAVAFVLLRSVRRPATGGVIRRSVRRTMQFTAGVILFSVSVSLWNSLGNLVSGSPVQSSESTAPVALSGMPGLFAGADALAVMRSTNETEARDALDRFANQMRGAGMENDEVADMLTEFRQVVPDRPWIAAAADSVLAGFAPAAARAQASTDAGAEIRDQLVVSYAAALQAGDQNEVDRIGGELAAVLSRDTVAALQTRIDDRSEMVTELRSALEERESDRGIMDTIRTLLDDLGLGFGWTGLYFTAFVVLWRGRTPGKRLMGLRIVRLDNRPIGWWNAFERFAGYAAGLATGLLGFGEIFWDRNRQAIQDKISRTVVVQE